VLEKKVNLSDDVRKLSAATIPTWSLTARPSINSVQIQHPGWPDWITAETDAIKSAPPDLFLSSKKDLWQLQ